MMFSERQNMTFHEVPLIRLELIPYTNDSHTLLTHTEFSESTESSTCLHANTCDLKIEICCGLIIFTIII